ncbi:conserved hypothetical protein [Planktothrix serta PCC 8927]|uniref:DUF2281 domain-containing protein n=1 Tax=Planktothrix serta PCC 8927 TaxID=671068 RepID=A0A7Z9DX88_9CYAN|nr:hypothetical protein [Planktothrix serta]VXD15809.1 conserved hypothetical protein [Planktothrix serta PCC 8927]
MNAIKELILDKLEHLETLSEPVLQEVLDFVSFLEWRLNTNQRPLPSSNLTENPSDSAEDTSAFLLEIASSFVNNLSDEDLDVLPRDGAEHHDRHKYSSQDV